MRVAKMIDIKKINIVDEPIPQISDSHDVLVQVKAVGICGTDLHIFKEGRADVQLPRIMGHELSGVVTAVGNAVGHVTTGDRVVLDPVFACGECPTCKKGYPNVCENVRCYGVQMDGGYQDYIVVHEKHLYPFDPSISFEQAALSEPFSIAANILDRTYLTEQDNVLVIGSGTIGLSIVQAAKGLGAKVMVADVVDMKLEKAKDMGADKVANSMKESLKDAAEAFCPGGFDVVIDAVGTTELFIQSLDYAAPRGRVACIGFDGHPAEIPPVQITKRELSIIGSRMNCYRFPTVMEWLGSGKIQSEKMITKKYPVDEIQKAFEDTIADNMNSIKTLIVF